MKKTEETPKPIDLYQVLYERGDPLNEIVGLLTYETSKGVRKPVPELALPICSYETLGKNLASMPNGPLKAAYKLLYDALWRIWNTPMNDQFKATDKDIVARGNVFYTRLCPKCRFMVWAGTRKWKALKQLGKLCQNCVVRAGVKHQGYKRKCPTCSCHK